MRKAILSLCLLSFSLHAYAADPVFLIFGGIGTSNNVRIWGRVIEDKGMTRPKKNESWTTRLKRSYRAFESDEIPHLQFKLKLGEQIGALKSNKEGFFEAEFKGLKVGVHHAKIIYQKTFRAIQNDIIVADPKGGIGVISDIDDTVLESNVKSKLKLLKKTIFSNARKLKSYPGCAKFYQQFEKTKMPIVFISGSPANLFYRLKLFFEYQKFPNAPIMLKDLGISKESDSLFKQKEYKRKKIKDIMALLPNHRFIIIGDSGEKDPEIYRAIEKEYPKRVERILIHNVDKSKPEDARYKGQTLFKSYLKLIN